MKLKDIYNLFVQEGIKLDFRSKFQINKYLRDKKNEYQKSDRTQKKFFDREYLTNPYSDTRILYGDLNKNIKRILVGIDLEIAELLMIKEMAREGNDIDLAIAHHPEGVALAGLYDVMGMQADILTRLGIENTVARDLITRRLSEVSRGLHGANHTRSVDAAKLLDIPYMCCHTPADNHVASYLQKKFDQKKPKTLRNIIQLLLQEPEYKDAMTQKAGPQILVGKPSSKAGKIFVDMTGGTEGSKNVFGRLSQLGVNTLVGMHLSEAHFQRVKDEHMNVIIAGHMASDNLGMNLLLDKLVKKSSIDIVACSGFRRFKR